MLDERRAALIHRVHAALAVVRTSQKLADVAAAIRAREGIDPHDLEVETLVRAHRARVLGCSSPTECDDIWRKIVGAV